MTVESKLEFAKQRRGCLGADLITPTMCRKCDNRSFEVLQDVGLEESLVSFRQATIREVSKRRPNHIYRPSSSCCLSDIVVMTVRDKNYNKVTWSNNAQYNLPR